MSERLKFILFVVFSLIVFWFTLILLCLPQGDPWPPASPAEVIVQDSLLKHHHAGRSLSSKARRSEPTARRRAPQSPDIMQIFNARPLSLLETIFYQFDPIEDVSNLTRSSSELIVSEGKHIEDTLSLASLNGPTEHYVKMRGDKLFSFNLIASNRVGLLRPLPDTRQAKCPRTTPATPFPTAHHTACSIVICYYNEAPSALLRTIYSILARTEHSLLREILIVDDFSEPGYDMDQIWPYLKSHTFSQPGLELVKFVRTPKREGLIRARLFGAAMAQGQVLVFLDSHVEPNVGWLEPLLSAIQTDQNKTTIACPMIDLINAETMLYTASPMVKGGLSWALHFKWASVPASTLKTYDDFVKPIKSPSMAGGLYAIHREYFYHLGAYDPGMNLWGGENIELSLKVWMCGGQILILPCSRVGHIFRKTRPYGPAAHEPDSLTYNSHRVARVWLDEHANNYYREVPQARDLDSGDISERLELRRNLKCQNFTWFLDNVYPEMRDQLTNQSEIKQANEEKLATGPMRPLANSRRINRSVGHPRQSKAVTFVLNDNNSKQSIDYQLNDLEQSPASIQVISMFQIQLFGSNLCLEPKLSLMKQLKFSRLVLEECAVTSNNLSLLTSISRNQLWTETESHEIRLASYEGIYCLDIMKNLPLLRTCHNMGSYQAWTHSLATRNRTSLAYPTTHIMSYFSSGNLCLAVERVQRGEPVIVTICDRNHDDGMSTVSGSNSQTAVQRRRQGRRRRRHKEVSAKSSNRDGSDEGSWLTGPLPTAQAFNQRRSKISLVGSSLVVHQKWIFKMIQTTTT